MTSAVAGGLLNVKPDYASAHAGEFEYLARLDRSRC